MACPLSVGTFSVLNEPLAEALGMEVSYFIGVIYRKIRFAIQKGLAFGLEDWALVKSADIKALSPYLRRKAKKLAEEAGLIESMRSIAGHWRFKINWPKLAELTKFGGISEYLEENKEKPSISKAICQHEPTEEMPLTPWEARENPPATDENNWDAHSVNIHLDHLLVREKQERFVARTTSDETEVSESKREEGISGDFSKFDDSVEKENDMGKGREKERQEKRQNALSTIRGASQADPQAAHRQRLAREAGRRASAKRAAVRTSARSKGYEEIQVEELISGDREKLRPTDFHKIYCHYLSEIGQSPMSDVPSVKDLGSWKQFIEWLKKGGVVDAVDYIRLAIKHWDTIRVENYLFRDFRTPSVQILCKHDYAREIWAILCEKGFNVEQMVPPVTDLPQRQKINVLQGLKRRVK